MFELRYHPAVVEEDIPALDGDTKSRLKAAIESRLSRAPCDYGKPLRGELRSLWALRVGDYRVIYQVRGEAVVILRIVNRRDAYRAGFLEARRRGLL